MIGPLSADEPFLEEDLLSLVAFELQVYATNVGKVVEEMELPLLDPDQDTAQFRSDLSMRVASLLRSQPRQHRIHLPHLRSQHSVVRFPVDDVVNGSWLEMVAVVNPLSTAAQALSPLLQTLEEVLPINLTLILNPQLRISELPVKRYYYIQS